MSLNSISGSQYTDTYSAYSKVDSSKDRVDKNTDKAVEDKAAVYEKSGAEGSVKKAA